MSDRENRLLKSRLERARYLLHDHYCFMRTHGVEAEYEEAQRVARFLLDTYGDDAEVILSGYLVAQTKDDES